MVHRPVRQIFLDTLYNMKKSDRLEVHMKNDEVALGSINETLNFIKKNHLEHMETDLSGLKEHSIVIKTDMFWVKWGIMLVLGGILTLFFKK